MSIDDVRIMLFLEVWSDPVSLLNLLLFLSRYQYQMILLSGSCSQLTKAHISTKHLRIFFTTNTILVNSLTDRRCILIHFSLISYSIKPSDGGVLSSKFWVAKQHGFESIHYTIIQSREYMSIVQSPFECQRECIYVNYTSF